MNDPYLMTVTRNKKTRFIVLGNLLIILVFAISIPQLSLYSSNQNTYFLHGLADSGLGFLSMDWLSKTTDPFPVFSALVNITIRFLGENAFYLFYILILSIYFYSILGITSYAYDISNSNISYLFLVVLLTMLYSGFLFSPLLRLVGFSGFWDFVPIEGPNGLLTSGVAGQFILGPMFQPSIFGVFIILSIYSFLRDKNFIAIAYLAIAATFHSTYLLSALALTCTYILDIFIKQKNYRKVLFVGTLALALVIPIITYIYLNFSPTTSNIANQAQSILVDYRIPHHAKPNNWFKHSTLFQITVIVLSIYLVRRRTKLFLVLLLPFLAATILTVIQVITGNKELALLFPWRISVFLVPIASSIIISGIVSFSFQVLKQPVYNNIRMLQTIILIVIMLISYLGICRTVNLLNAERVGLTASAKFATKIFQSDNLYLIPPEIESFRLATKIPIFVDLKSHPYKDIEVIEWFNKMKIAEEIYSTKNAEIVCNRLEKLNIKYGITHVIWKNNSLVINCSILKELYKDADFLIYEIRKNN